MVHVTQHAKEALLAVKRRAQIESPEIGLRLAVGRKGLLGLIPDRPKAGDQVVKHEEATVLLIDPQVSALVVSGRMIDGRRTEGGRTEIVLKRRLAA